MTELNNIFSLCKVDGNKIFPPNKQLEPKIYQDFKKILVNNLGKWKGGNLQAFEFPFNPQNLLESLKRGERPNFRQDLHYFPTPMPVIEMMFNCSVPLYDGKFLEPSAGKGAIIDGISELGGCHFDQKWDCYEINNLNKEDLIKKGFNVIGDDFANHIAKPEYDVVFANPPFRHAIEHLIIMVNCVIKGGQVVCVLPSSFRIKTANQPKILKMWEKINKRFDNVSTYDLPKGSFKEEKTLVDTVVAVMSDRL